MPRTLAASDVREFASHLRGQLIRPNDRGYDSARALWNGEIDRRPALVARCADERDVAEAANFARENDLLVAVRGGGHGVAGVAVCDDGMVIDLSRMRGVDVDPYRRTAVAQGGCTLADVDSETQRHGLATPLGVVSETGLAGLTLSGGLGWLRRKYGLSCDNLISAQVVTSDGQVLLASDTDNPDLFWAIRGGGGNFGVVTSFEYTLYPVGPEVFFCFVAYPAAETATVLRACDRYLATQPAEVGPVVILGRVPPAPDFPPEAHYVPFAAVLAMYPGEAADGAEALRPLREITEPLLDMSGAMLYTRAQTLLDGEYPDGMHYYWKSANVPELSDELIGRLTAHADAASPLSTIDIWYQGGAMALVGERETAFANRKSPYLIGIEGNWQPGEDSPANIAWVRDTYADLRAFSLGGVYLNFEDVAEPSERILRDGYGANMRRLAEVKARYDPTNFFHLNANIPPQRTSR